MYLSSQAPLAKIPESACAAYWCHSIIFWTSLVTRRRCGLTFPSRSLASFSIAAAAFPGIGVTDFFLVILYLSSDSGIDLSEVELHSRHNTSSGFCVLDSDEHYLSLLAYLSSSTPDAPSTSRRPFYRTTQPSPRSYVKPFRLPSAWPSRRRSLGDSSQRGRNSRTALRGLYFRSAQ